MRRSLETRPFYRQRRDDRSHAMLRFARTLNPALANVLAIALIAAAGLYTYGWVFGPDMTFYEDDWSWLRDAVFVSWSDLLLTPWAVLPASLFHDRPVESAIIKLL